MKVRAAAFVTSAAGVGDAVPRDALPQIALVGRSNVGKSSLINALARRKIARTSAEPGKTRLANFYRIEVDGGAAGRIALYLVDLPGYGYARGSKASRHDAAAELKAVAEAYFRGTSPAELKLRATAALLLIDARHPALDADVQAARWLGSMHVETHVVATKIDKLTRSERARHLTIIGNTFGTAALPVSAVSGEGLDELWKTIARIARDAGRRG